MDWKVNTSIFWSVCWKKSTKKWIYPVRCNMHERTCENTGFSGSHWDRWTDEWELMMILYAGTENLKAHSLNTGDKMDGPKKNPMSRDTKCSFTDSVNHRNTLEFSPVYTTQHRLINQNTSFKWSFPSAVLEEQTQYGQTDKLVEQLDLADLNSFKHRVMSFCL